jgi:hypothetical protein
MMDIGIGLARAISSVVGMRVLALMSGSHRSQATALDNNVERYRPYRIVALQGAATRLGLQKLTPEQALQ